VNLRVAGGRIAYWDAGRGPALVVIHGAGTPGELLRSDLAELSREFRVITYDRRGYGASSESPLSWQAHGDDAAALIGELGTAPAVVLGYSAGAIVALELALEHPDLVAGLVLIEPTVYMEGALSVRCRLEYLKAQLLRRLRGERRGADSWIRYISTYSTGGSAWDRAVPERRERILANAAGIFADMDSGDAAHIEPGRLAAIDVPVTILNAELTPPFLRRSGERLRALMPQAHRVTLEESSHIVMLDARTAVLDVLRDAVGERRAGYMS